MKPTMDLLRSYLIMKRNIAYRTPIIAPPRQVTFPLMSSMPPCTRYDQPGEKNERVMLTWMHAVENIGVPESIKRLHDHKGTLHVICDDFISGRDVRTLLQSWSRVGAEEQLSLEFMGSRYLPFPNELPIYVEIDRNVTMGEWSIRYEEIGPFFDDDNFGAPMFHDEITEWCAEELSEDYSIEPCRTDHTKALVGFENEDDAFMFKMRWG